jgi:protein-tyrosine phosphatase
LSFRTLSLDPIVLLPIVFVLAACGAPSEPVVPPDNDPMAVRQNDGSVWLRWQSAPKGRVRVFVGNDPETVLSDAASDEQGDGGAALGELERGEFVATELPGDTRPYFALVPDAGLPIVVAERLLPLEGAHNFRDLGGYPTADGRRVKWGRIYRSDHLGDLTDDDLAYLEGLGIRTVCDFRSAVEREASPDRFGESGTPRTVNPDISDDRFAMDELQDQILSGDLGDTDFTNLLIEGNRAFARDYTDQYAQFLRLAENPDDLPMVFHCTAGKDRAGFGAVVLLMALGVPEKVAIDDYLLTQPYTQHNIESTLRLIRFASLFRTDTERVRPLLGVQLAYIRAGVDTAEREYGSMDAYLEKGLGLTPERRAALQDLLLE